MPRNGGTNPPADPRYQYNGVPMMCRDGVLRRFHREPGMLSDAITTIWTEMGGVGARWVPSKANHHILEPLALREPEES